GAELWARANERTSGLRSASPLGTTWCFRLRTEDVGRPSPSIRRQARCRIVVTLDDAVEDWASAVAGLRDPAFLATRDLQDVGVDDMAASASVPTDKRLLLLRAEAGGHQQLLAQDHRLPPFACRS